MLRHVPRKERVQGYRRPWHNACEGRTPCVCVEEVGTFVPDSETFAPPPLDFGVPFQDFDIFVGDSGIIAMNPSDPGHIIFFEFGPPLPLEH